MKVYSLSGKSGTGKSYQAISLCKELNIDSIIDDGLFIHHNQVIAGISAKRQQTRVGAIKTALFTDDAHAESVSKAIKTEAPDSLLVIGTSDRMIDKIVTRLDLPPISKRIYIEDITSEEERDAAIRQRRTQGKHVIPVPTMQLKRDFAGYFLDPMRIIYGMTVGKDQKDQVGEKTVVRPTFSYMGGFIISEKVLTDIADLVASEISGIGYVIKVYENTSPDNLIMDVAISVRMGYSLWDTAIDFQHRLTEVIERMTAFNITRVDVEIRGIE